MGKDILAAVVWGYPPPRAARGECSGSDDTTTKSSFSLKGATFEKLQIAEKKFCKKM
jgi:hypothetical protein